MSEESRVPIPAAAGRGARAQTEGTQLAGLLSSASLSTGAQQLLPPSLFTIATAAAAAAAASSSSPDSPLAPPAAKKRTARKERAPAHERAHTPTQDELEQIEADEMLAVAAVQKAKDRVAIKVARLTDLHGRLTAARRAFAARKAERMHVLLETKRAELLQRQNSEDE